MGLIIKNKIIRYAAGIICSVLVTIFITLSIPIFLFRVFIFHVFNFIRSDLGSLLNGISSALVNDLFSSKPPRSNIVVTIVIRGHGTLEEVKDLVLKNWIEAKDKNTGELNFKKFQQHPVRWLGFTFWKDGFHTFKLENHVKQHYPVGGVNHVTEEDLNNVVEKLLNASFLPETSPWELHLVNNYKNSQMQRDPSDELSVLLFKVHHSLADGFSILSALVEGFCEHPLTDVQLPVPRFPKRTALEKLWYILTFPFCFYQELSYGLSNIFRPNPWKISNEKKDWYHVCWKSDLIPVQHIKDIKNALGVSFTGVLLAVISNGVHLSLKDRKKKRMEAGLEIEDDDSSMYFLSVLPVPGHSKRLTNHTTGAFFDLPTGEFPSSIERIMACEAVIEETKRTVTPIAARHYVSSLGWLFYPIGRMLFKNRMVTAGLTNFPSVPIKIEKNGKTGIAVDFAVGCNDGVAGVGIMVLSYNQHLRIVVTAERAVMSKAEVKEFVGYITNEINLLHLNLSF